jgi:hypothetical protein
MKTSAAFIAEIEKMVEKLSFIASFKSELS